jgi:hypothetical protein
VEEVQGVQEVQEVQEVRAIEHHRGDAMAITPMAALNADDEVGSGGRLI